ncbi:TPA: hypothetical protein N0F65_010399 [Lagenidium giganteum]|uniref:Uncharacterized protein n=1 Tax=Lagenidium giganteum TaxID=4803 RepID=A0AAV2YQG7_9STRA|nr:TPA: hypothetical protein N0F65_010399 [Lagenidium giganteum]
MCAIRRVCSAACSPRVKPQQRRCRSPGRAPSVRRLLAPLVVILCAAFRDGAQDQQLLADRAWRGQLTTSGSRDGYDGVGAGSSSNAVALRPGAHVHGYELVERTALLGVCNHQQREREYHEPQAMDVVVRYDEPSVGTCSAFGAGTATPDAALPSPPLDGPSLEYQARVHDGVRCVAIACVLEEEAELIYVNANYRLRKKFDAGSHGEVWRATRVHADGREQRFVLKRLFVELGASMLRMGLREARFGTLLQGERHVARFVESFFSHTNDSLATTTTTITTATMTAAPTPSTSPSFVFPALDSAGADTVAAAHQELWLVFYDEGISLRKYLYTKTESAHSAVIFEPSAFWHQLRGSAAGEAVLREIMRQLLEAVAALHDRGITHRDIKPSNILLHLHNDPTQPPLVKLADFGSAVDADTLEHWYDAPGPTQAEETREYQPPEVLFSDSGQPYDLAQPWTYDLWSVGVVFLEMVLGSPQVFMISSRARAKLDAQLRQKEERVRLKSYLLHVLTKEFCIFQPLPGQLHALWDEYALVSDGCHFGRFNLTIIERDPLRQGLADPWALDLMWKLLQWTPSHRISARDALNHAFFRGPFVCQRSGRSFATQAELDVHEAYLAAEEQREQEMAFIVKERYELPTEFECPQCHRRFSTIGACEQNMHTRQHARKAGSDFCQFDGSALRRAVHTQSVAAAAAATTELDGRRVGVALFQGKKKYMEDLVLVRRHDELGFSMLAVMDGHLGVGAAQHVHTHLFDLLVRHLTTALANSTSDDKRAFAERVALRQTFIELHNSFLASLQVEQQPQVDFSGSTLTVVLVFEAEQRVLTANVGDSTAILVPTTTSTTKPDNNVTPTVVTTDHWPNVSDERARIESSGGFVSFAGLWRVVGQLAVSRSIGDQHLRQYVTAEPSIATFHYDAMAGDGTDDSVLVVASDGLWEVMTPDDVARFITQHVHLQATQRDNKHADAITWDAIAEQLTVEAYARGSLDNLAVILMPLTQPTTLSNR